MRALGHLDRDFELGVNTVRGEPAFKLGDWRAFRGQENHLRHLAFAEDKLRSPIS